MCLRNAESFDNDDDDDRLAATVTDETQDEAGEERAHIVECEDEDEDVDEEHSAVRQAAGRPH